MKGTEWIVPVVVLIVWLVSTILKSREQDEPVRPKPAGGGDGRKPTGDIDRCLPEIDRLKRRAAEERGATARPAPPRVRPVPAQAVPRVRPVQRPARVEPPMVVVESVPIVTPASAPPVLPQPAAHVAPKVSRTLD